MTKQVEITNFADNEYLQSALYQSFRTIGNYIDGLKPGARKVIYTTDKFNVKENIKTSSLASKTIEHCQYLHGPMSLESTIAGIAQTFVGSNTLNLLVPDGNFGTRFEPEPAASRYIYTRKSEWFDKVFKREDRDILTVQNFEGEQIEYKFYVPVVPLLLVNGNSGVGNGFAQIVLPRSLTNIVNEIKNYLKARASNKEYKIRDLNPFFKGFKADIRLDEVTGSWKIYGKFERMNQTNIRITEVPIGYTLKQYIKVLDNLSDNKVIKDYRDKSEDDKFEFILNVTREFSDQTDEEIYTQLKLIKRESENFTCVDENNSIREFKSAEEILEAFIKIRLQYYDLRKKSMVEKLKNDLMINYSKFLFVKGIIEGSIVVNNKKKEDIVKQIEKNEKIIKQNNCYDYLLQLPVYSLTREKLEELKEKIEKLKLELKELNGTLIEQLWLNDLIELQK